MEKKWLNKYPKGIPAEVDVKEFSSVVELFQHGVEKYGHKPAFANMGRVFSYAEMDEKSRALAAFLQQDLGLQKGERVAIMMPNLLQYPVSIFAVLRAGLIVVNVNPLYTHRELQYQLNDSGASVIVILENFAHVLADILPNTVIKKVIITRLGDLLSYPKSVLINVAVKYLKRMVPRFYIQDAIDFNQALATGGSREYKQREVTGEDVAFLQYTAGTTGVSKGAMLTHRNIVANVVQASAWIAPFVKEGSEVIITALPLYHIFSLTANCLLFLNLGGLNYLITNPRDMKGFVRVDTPVNDLCQRE